MYCACYSSEVLRVQDTRQVTLLDALQRQRRDQRGPDTAAVLGGQDLDRVLLGLVLLLRPVEDLAQGLRPAGLEVRVLVEDGPVGAHVAALVALLLADGRDSAGRQAGRARADQLGCAADEFQLGPVGADVELGLEEFQGLR